MKSEEGKIYLPFLKLFISRGKDLWRRGRKVEGKWEGRVAHRLKMNF
jgi:hypothetical protein